MVIFFKFALHCLLYIIVSVNNLFDRLRQQW